MHEMGSTGETGVQQVWSLAHSLAHTHAQQLNFHGFVRVDREH